MPTMTYELYLERANAIKTHLEEFNILSEEGVETVTERQVSSGDPVVFFYFKNSENATLFSTLLHENKISLSGHKCPPHVSAHHMDGEETTHSPDSLASLFERLKNEINASHTEETSPSMRW